MALQLDVDTLEHDELQQRTRTYTDEYGLFEKCPLVKALDLVRRKWAIQIVMILYRNNEPIRFNQLERELVPITQKELTKRLRELEEAGIISRTIYPEIPPHVEYTLTESGRAFKLALSTLGEWSNKYYDIHS